MSYERGGRGLQDNGLWFWMDIVGCHIVAAAGRDALHSSAASMLGGATEMIM